MIRSSKFALAAFLVILASLSFYAFKIYRQRNPITEEKAASQSAEQQIGQSSPSFDETFPDDEQAAVVDNSAVDSSDEDANEATADEKNNFLDVSRNDCNNNCKDFSDPEDLKYCQQVCGLTPIKKEVKEKKGCDALKDLEKDYCLKDLAINKGDIKICSDIEDTDIKKVCKNRIAQDFLDSQNQL